MQPTRNLAERAGVWSARHRKKAILGWLAFVIAAVVIGGAVGTNTLNQDETGSGESGKANKTELAAFPDKAGENVLVEARDGQRAGDRDFRAAVADVQRRLGATKHVRRIQGPTRRATRAKSPRAGSPR